jgi:hypothetical protein
MKQLLVALSAGTFAVASMSALAQFQGDNDTPQLTTGQTSAAKAERDAARAKWAAMTPDQKAAVKKAAASKRAGDLTALEKVGDDDMADLPAAQTAAYKSDRAAAKAKFAAMSPEQKAAMAKAARQKKLSELSTLEKLSIGAD